MKEKQNQSLLRSVSLAWAWSTIGIFVLHLPLRYEDETRITRVCDLKRATWAQIQATVTSGVVLKAVVSCSSSPLFRTEPEPSKSAFLHFYPKCVSAFKSGTELRLAGRVQQQPAQFGGALQMLHLKSKIRSPIHLICPQLSRPFTRPENISRRHG